MYYTEYVWYKKCMKQTMYGTNSVLPVLWSAGLATYLFNESNLML